MRIYLLPLTLTAALMSPTMALAEDVQHYQAKSSDTLEEAVINFNDSNGRLEALLAGDLDDANLAQIHELTYTLENALAKIQLESGSIAESLEAVHQASERSDAQAVRQHGVAYLGAARNMIN